jgi:predicted ATPase/DNA-binding SARP family transcriptional activator
MELLGRLRVIRGDRAITRFRWQKTALLLAYLAYYRGRPQSREVLVELLWPGCDPELGRDRLSTALSSLRRQLEPPDLPTHRVLIADRWEVGVNPDAVTTDVAEFEAAVAASARARSDLERSSLLEEAVEAYSGELLPGYVEEWVLQERERLAEQFLQTIGQLIRSWEQQGDLSRALRYARRGVAVDALREDSHAELIRVLIAAGQMEAARRQYQELERLLDQELGAEPTPETRALLDVLADGARGRGGEGATRAGPCPPALRLASASVAPSPDPPRSARRVPPLAPSSLPTGTVTFFLADRLPLDAWRSAKDAVSTPAAASGEQVQRELERYEGQVIREASGMLFVAFQRASDALAAAILLQKRAASSGLFRPRMALHTAEVGIEAGQHDGVVPDHLVRLLRAAHPGQILLSETTATLLRGETEPGKPGGAIADLGLYRLWNAADGTESVERLFQASSIEIAPREFPPPRAEPVQQGNLPPQLSRFFGRDAEITDLRRWLLEGETRLVTLTGPGGSGKSRLALAVAETLVERFRGAVWFIPLAELIEAGRLPDAVVSALGLPRTPEEEPLEQAVVSLSRQPSLLVFDSFEHLLPEGALFMRTLLSRAPTLTAMVTSRQRLNLSGEREFVTQPLPTPHAATGRRADGATGREDGSSLSALSPPLPVSPSALLEYPSVQLFLDRAQAVRPDFQVTRNNAAAVAELCRRLEGLPLALELAAARSSVLTPPQLLEQLTRRFEVLVSRQRDMPTRHRSLHAAIEWSYHLLSPELQRCFARLSVFRGGWTLEAADAVCGNEKAPTTPFNVLDALAELRECSLVLAEEEGTGMRYRMLETLREFAFEQLSLEERAQVARQHAEYYLLLAEHGKREDPDPDQEPWLERIERERLNLQVALGWSLADESGAETALRLVAALRGFWENHPTEGREWVAAALAAQGDQPAARRAEALHVAGRLALMQNDLLPGRAALEECLALQRASGNRAGMATLLHTLGQCVSALGEYEEARALLEEAAAIRRELGDGPGTAWTLGSLAWMLQSQGDLEQARRCLEESLAIARECGVRLATAQVLHGLGWIRAMQGDRTAAESYLKESCAVASELTGRPDPAPVTYGMRRHAWRETDEETARYLLEANLAFWRALGNPWEVIHALGALGHLARQQGDYAGCAAFYRESLAPRQERGDRFTIAQSLEDFAGLAARQGEHQRAARLLGAADALCARLGRSLPVAWPDEYRRTMASAREALGEEAFAAARSAGRVMSLQEAIDDACEARNG